MQKLRDLVRRIGIPMLEALLVVLCLSLMARPAHASVDTATHNVSSLEVTFNDEPLWRAPALYSLRVMGVGLAGLVTLGLHHSDPDVENFKRAFESPSPRRDDDGPVFNYMLHPLWGSETYLRARRSGMDRGQSFMFSMTASVAWEYLIESWTEHPSRQDLLYTTGIGWLIGEGRHYLLDNLDEDQKIWVDPLYTAMRNIDLNARISPDGALTPILGIGWQF